MNTRSSLGFVESFRKVPLLVPGCEKARHKKPLVVRRAHHERLALRQAQGERAYYDPCERGLTQLSSTALFAILPPRKDPPP